VAELSYKQLSVPYLGSNCLELAQELLVRFEGLIFQYPTSGRTAWSNAGVPLILALGIPFSTLPRVELPGAPPGGAPTTQAATPFSTLPRVELPGAFKLCWSR